MPAAAAKNDPSVHSIAAAMSAAEGERGHRRRACDCQRHRAEKKSFSQTALNVRFLSVRNRMELASFSLHDAQEIVGHA
jgi:hypothetical protein